MSLLAYFLDKLRAVEDGDGSLLDHSLIMYGSGICNGQTHSHSNLPTLLAGGGGGRVTGGRHIACAKDTPLANLQLRILEKVDVKLEEFGEQHGHAYGSLEQPTLFNQGGAGRVNRRVPLECGHGP